MSDPFLLRIHRGDTEQFSVLVTDPATGQAIDITTMSLRFTAKYRTTDTDTDAVIVKVSDYGGISFGAGTGEALITIDPEDTVDLTKTTTLLWDLQITDFNGSVRTAAPSPGKSARLIIYADVSITVP